MNKSGFTLVELLIVIAMIAILVTLAVPSFREWITKTEYRTAARDVANVLRQAKGRSISKNREYEVSVNLSTDVYLIREGAQATGSSSWTVIDDFDVPPSVDLRGVDCGENSDNDYVVQFNPNGTTETTGYNVCIVDRSNPPETKYIVNVNRMGRITMP